MFILLSSATRPRYKEDIIRCLAAPIGSRLQFRYDKKWVSDSILQDTSNLPKEAVVCFVDNDASGTGALPLIPIRAITIERISKHGSTISLLFRVQEFLYADSTTFTNEIFTLSGQVSPAKNRENEVSGKYLFPLSGTPSSVTKDCSVKQWEKTVDLISLQPAFQDEAFFWTVLGVESSEMKRADTEVFSQWAFNLEGGQLHQLLVYHYYPSSVSPPKERSTLSITVGGGLNAISPNEIDIDSRYDLKRWDFKTELHTRRLRHGWLRIGPGGRWGIDLPLSIEGSLGKAMLVTLVAGILIAGPSILVFIQQPPPSGQCVGILFSLILGICAAATFVFGLQRFD